MKTIIAVNGACGRMGQRIVQLAHAYPELTIGAALDSSAHPNQGRDAGELAGIGALGLPMTAQIAPHQRIDVVIDFSMPEGTLAILPACVDRRIPIVVATTGFTDEQKKAIEAAAHHTAVLISPNMSLVVNVLFKLVREAGTDARRQVDRAYRLAFGRVPEPDEQVRAARVVEEFGLSTMARAIFNSNEFLYLD